MVHLDLDPTDTPRRVDVEALYLTQRYRTRQMLLAAAFTTAGILVVAAAMVVGM